MRCSRVVARRAGNGSRSSCRASTPAPSTPDGPRAFQRHQRITSGAELRTIGRAGKRLRSGHLDVRMAASLLCLPHARVGLVVPRHRRSAVERNTLKRQLRELARTILLPDAPPVDLVLHARPSAYTLGFTKLVALIENIRTQVQRAAAVLPAGTPETPRTPLEPPAM